MLYSKILSIPFLLNSSSILIYNKKNLYLFMKGVFMSQNTFSMFLNERFIDLNIYQFGYEQCSPYIPLDHLSGIIISFII